MHAPPSAATCCIIARDYNAAGREQSCEACNIAGGMRRHSKDERNMNSLRAATDSQLQLGFGMCKICPKKKAKEEQEGRGRARQSIARVKAWLSYAQQRESGRFWLPG